MDQKKTIRPFSMKDKIGYTLGDLGCCFTEQYRAMYLSIFYTLILQVNPFHVGILLLITKIWDAVNDPIIGAIVDSRKATKGGKFIPWIRAFSFPMAVLCVLALSMWATSATVCVWPTCSSPMCCMRHCTPASTCPSAPCPA